MRYIFDENNSWWYTIVCKCLWVIPAWWVDAKHVKVIADSINDAVSIFNKRFNIDADYESSYEWWSCSCCGRRFTVRTDDNKAKEEYTWLYMDIYYTEDLSYEEEDCITI